MAFVVVGQWKRPGRRQPVGDHHPGAWLPQGSHNALCWAKMVPVPDSGGGGGGGGLVNTGDWRGRPAPVVVHGEVLPVGALHASTMQTVSIPS